MPEVLLEIQTCYSVKLASKKLASNNNSSYGNDYEKYDCVRARPKKYICSRRLSPKLEGVPPRSRFIGMGVSPPRTLFRSTPFHGAWEQVTHIQVYIGDLTRAPSAKTRGCGATQVSPDSWGRGCPLKDPPQNWG